MVAYFFVFFVRWGEGGLFPGSIPPLPTAPWSLGSLGPVSGDAGLDGNLGPGGTGPGFSPKEARAFGAHLLYREAALGDYYRESFFRFRQRRRL